MHHLLLDLKAHNMQNRTVALIENGTWAASSGKLMAQIVSDMKEMDLMEGTVSLRSAVGEDQLTALKELAQRLAASLDG
jgi:flavorubredoxin